MKNFNFNRAWESYVSSEILLIQKCVFSICFKNTHTHYSKGFKVLYITLYAFFKMSHIKIKQKDINKILSYISTPFESSTDLFEQKV